MALKVLKLKEWLLAKQHQFKFDDSYPNEKVAIRIKDSITFFKGGNILFKGDFCYIVDFLPDMINVSIYDQETSSRNSVVEIDSLEVLQRRPRRRVSSKK